MSVLTIKAEGYELTLVVEDLERASRDATAVDFYVRIGEAQDVGPAFTLNGISMLMERYRSTGECGQGKFFWASNVLILENFKPETFRMAVAEMISTGEDRQALSEVDDVQEG